MHRGSRVLAALAGLALVASACGGGSGSDDGSGGGGGGPATTAPAGEAVDGGTLVYGVEADSDGFDPTRNRWAISGTMVGLAVFDPLVQFDEENVPRPYLAESIEPNEDSTVWTIVLRPGITFHDGTPLTADAVVQTLEGHMASGLTKPAIAPLESVTAVDDLTVEATMDQPWVAFPAALAAQLGVIPAPSMLDDPEDGPRNPVGTGPFVFEEWVAGDHWFGTKNPDYWREGLPHLDRVEFRVIPDSDSRLRALKGGEADVVHTSAPDVLATMQDEADAGEYQILVSDGEGEEDFVMFNLEAPPLDDVRVRRAVAHATDRDRFVELTAAGIVPVADSMFTPESPWYADTDYPEYDPGEAQRLVDEYEAEVGPIEFELGTTPSTANQRDVSVLADMWSEVGIDATPKFTEQSAFIIDGLGGRYEANWWRQFGAVDPDADSHWWRSDSTLNFARIRDDEVDDALRRGRAGTTMEARQEAYADLQARFAELVPYVWVNHTLWGLGYGNDVHGITATFPDGEHTIPMGNNFTAVHLLTEMWKDA